MARRVLPKARAVLDDPVGAGVNQQKHDIPNVIAQAEGAEPNERAMLEMLAPVRELRIVAVDDHGKEFDARPGQDATIVAAELEFPGGSWNLALAFTPARKVQIDGTKVQFVIPIREPATRSPGFCRPGSLDEWRRAGKPAR